MNKSTKTFSIEGVELTFSFTNADHVQKWAESRERISEKYAAIEQCNPDTLGLMGYADLIRDACNAIFELFDGIFGEGTAESIFGGEYEFEACTDAYALFEEQVESQAEAFSTKTMQRYQPDMRKSGSK